MQRYTISIEDSLAEEFEKWIERYRYENRSEAIRDLLRDRFAAEALADEATSKDAAACVSYIYDHHQRELGRRLTHDQHTHYDLTISTLHVHLDHDQCLEVALLRGDPTRVRQQAQALIAEKGVRHGKVHLLPIAAARRKRHRHTHPHNHD